MSRIEIIVPVYNAKHCLSKLLDSFERQTNKDYSVCIIDDGSTDGTFEYCKKKQGEMSVEMKVLSQKNQGPGIARKTGLIQSNAGYIMFCDADDYLADNAINTVYEALDNLDVLEFGFERVDEEGHVLNAKILKNENVDHALAHYVYQVNTTNFLWNKVFKRNVINADDFKKLFYSEDALALTYIFSRVKNYKVIEDKLYYYVMNKNSACGQRYSLKRMDVLKADKSMSEIIERADASLSPYVSFNNCVHVTKLYQGFIKEKILSEAVDKELRLLFDLNYSKMKVNKADIYKIKSTRQKRAVDMFHFSAALFKMLCR